MKFLLVLSDAFDALWAIRGRVALALGGVALLGVLVAIYLPMMPGGESPSRPSVAVHNPIAQGSVERAKVEPQAAAPIPAPAPAPAPQAAASDPGSVPEHATVPEQLPPAPPQAAEAVPAPEPARAPAPEAAPKFSAEPAFRVQVGAFRETERARALSRRLTRAGFPTSIERGTTPDGNTIYRVRTRQALPRGEAQQLVARLRHRVPALRPILVPGGKAAG